MLLDDHSDTTNNPDPSPPAQHEKLSSSTSTQRASTMAYRCIFYAGNVDKAGCTNYSYGVGAPSRTGISETCVITGSMHATDWDSTSGLKTTSDQGRRVIGTLTARATSSTPDRPLLLSIPSLCFILHPWRMAASCVLTERPLPRPFSSPLLVARTCFHSATLFPPLPAQRPG